MNWHFLAAAPILLSLSLAPPALAVSADWQTDESVGANQVVYTLALSCPAAGLVCDLIDGYLEQATSVATGTGSLGADDIADTFRFDSDSSQDVGSGPQPAYATVTGSDVSFPNIPFAGVPELTNLLVFALSDPNVPAAGLDLETPADYPFSQTIQYSGSGLVVGDLEFLLGPVVVVPPDAVVVSGTLRVLGDVDLDGDVDLELRDVTGSFQFQNVTSIAGESVTVDVTADMTLNLSTPLSPLPAPVPTLGPLGVLALGTLLLMLGSWRLSRVLR